MHLELVGQGESMSDALLLFGLLRAKYRASSLLFSKIVESTTMEI